MLSVYIPVVLASMTTEDFVREVFKINKIGTVSHVDFVFNGTKHSAYVHFSEWESNSSAEAFKCLMEEEKASRIYFDYPGDYEYKTGYWICLKNKSTKTNHQTPKVRIDVSGLQDAEDVYEEEEEEEEDVYEEEEELAALHENDVRLTKELAALQEHDVRLTKELAALHENDVRLTKELAALHENDVRLTKELAALQEHEEEEEEDAWMDELMENDADTESEAWDFMMEELAKEEAAKANYVRSLEEEVAHLHRMLQINAENAYYAQNAWNHERTHLINTARHFENAANELYLTNRSLSGFLQNPAPL
jgi:hypothetical protein